MVIMVIMVIIRSGADNMKYTLLKYFIALSLVFVSGVILMDISHRVQIVESDIKNYDRSIAREQEAIRVLKAEWAYLNDPARLERLVSGAIGLTAPRAENIVSDIDVVVNDEVEEAFSVSEPKSPLYREISTSSHPTFSQMPALAQTPQNEQLYLNKNYGGAQ